MREYGITLLAAYGNLRKTADFLERAIERKAVGAFAAHRRNALETAEEICGMLAEKQLYRDLAAALEDIFSEMAEEDRLLLEYKYFRRPDAARYARLNPAGRTYFRRQVRAYDRFCARLLAGGMSQKWFNENVLVYEWMRELHRKVLIAERRKQRAAETKKKAAPGGAAE